MIKRLILALSLSLPLAQTAAAQAGPVANRYAATIAAAERFTVGDTLVERHGSGSPALILIPGLASGAWVWQETVRQFAPQHSIYVLTLPGFDGHPAVPGKGMAAAMESVRELIASRKLVRPILIGHSLGGIMSIDLAARYPDLVRGVVSIDGLPVFPGTEQWPQAQRSAMSATLAARRSSPALFAEQQQQYMSGTGTIDMSRAADLARLTAKSDPAAVARYMADGIGLDLRSALPAIKAPVLVLSPFAAVDGDQLQMNEEGKTAYYKSLMQGTPNVTVQSISPARHFAMFDQPQKVNDALRAFIAGLPR
ncbi:alpha/beta hydrolase [Massilia sp. PAMC28688]|uniref:alpha/beta fold hydrolase n=1 Tax=Massilia sp. PAMC28688 TaxID=2861283 RepID=UPI001C62D7CE|nr:alpha/beta hydrolase [Massilia sp. PAMC28688]QYF93188.1 alpha/beta hydrolase [Massilia sp. PAMC28688]